MFYSVVPIVYTYLYGKFTKKLQYEITYKRNSHLYTCGQLNIIYQLYFKSCRYYTSLSFSRMVMFFWPFGQFFGHPVPSSLFIRSSGFGLTDQFETKPQKQSFTEIVCFQSFLYILSASKLRLGFTKLYSHSVRQRLRQHRFDLLNITTVFQRIIFS